MIVTEHIGVTPNPGHTDAVFQRRQGLRSRSLGLVRCAVRLAAASVCATLATASWAVDASRLDFLPAIVAAVRKEADLPSDALRINGPFVDRAAVTSGGVDYGFAEYLPWQQLRIAFDLRTVRDQETVLVAMRALRKSLNLACGGYAIQHYPIGERITRIVLSQPYDTFMSDVYTRLFDEGLIGGFECQQSRSEVSPRISVTWETGNRRPTEVIPAHDWRFLVEFIDRDQIRAHLERFEQHRRKVDDLRAKPIVGADVQVMADDLPSGYLARFQQPVNRLRLPYAICGLITEIRGPLAQVQMQSDTLMLPIRKLLPAGQRIPVDEMSRRIDLRAPTQQACLR